MAKRPTDWHAASVQDVFSLLRAKENGLTGADAAKRLEKHGPNALPREESKPWWRVLLDQFRSPLMTVLIASAGVSVALGDAVDAGVIVAAVVVNSVLGFAQEFQANRAMERLRSLVQQTAVVRRDGRDRPVPAEEIVPGDLVVFAAGDKVSADVRLVECMACEANEAALTGESAPVSKMTEAIAPGAVLAERSNMLFAGTSLVAGRGVGIAVATGTNTELGAVARLVGQTEERATPLQSELKRLARRLSFAVVVIVALLFGVGVAFGRAPLGMFQTAVALAVAAIPEGLGISVTVVLAIGMRRMARKKALTRRLIAAETLGSVSVICTDKTGTITEGRMVVSEVVGDKRVVLGAVMLCNDTVVSGDDLRGTPTDRALMEAAIEAGLDPRAANARHPRLAERPFDSIRKYMATLHASGERPTLLVKGAPERVIPMCRAEDAGRLAEATALAEQGLRLIAVARRMVPPRGAIVDADLKNLTFLGFVALRDPLRAEAAAQIRAARRAGVRTVMVTGDHPKTARAIGREAGLVVGGDGVASGEDLDAWDDAELDRRVAGVQVYARVEPRHKIRVVQAWQRRGAVVAVTGDGVNDAPALKAADIGVALGSGTEVAKEAADMVLLDDNLGTITSAIGEGRAMFDNMRRSVVYLFTGGFTEVVLITGALLMGLPLPLLPAHILWINLVTDALPNIALAFEPAEPDVLSRPPRPRGEAVFNRQMAVLLLSIGIVTDLVLFGLYLWVLQDRSVEEARSFLFAAVGVASLAYVFAIRSFRRSLFRMNPFSNRWLVAAVAFGLVFMALPFVVPGLAVVLETVPLSLSDWALLLMIGVLKLGIIEVVKRFVVKSV